MDRGYIDFERLYVFTLSSAFFVVRTKSNVLLQRRYSQPVDKSMGVRSDHTVILTAFDSAKVYPDALRRVSYLDVETRKRFKFLTNPVTNTMLVGCNNVAGQALVSLVDGTVLTRFPQANTDNVMGFNPGNRRWYSASGSNTNNGGICPPTNTGTVFLIVGVFAAGAASAPTATLVGAAACKER
jgi:hypothetical protein